jgi:hypothetical protein
LAATLISPHRANEKSWNVPRVASEYSGGKIGLGSTLALLGLGDELALQVSPPMLQVIAAQLGY